MKESLTIGKAIEDPRIINLCERKLKELEETDDCENLDEAQSSNEFFKKIFSKIKPKKEFVKFKL